MAGTNKALVCFWLAMLLALSSEDVGVSDASCIPAVSLGCLKDSGCRKTCLNDDEANTSWKCRNFLCICCK
ncbi:hypothetical protein PVAP13_2KG477600 [Panicum virgatum]|uniref:Knottin scorpion toxin-like domain-containing protein n=1 Tax=Panicum virgatum TaxID=38727 RepID=A0A8T0WIL1_PANVG|nr:hypothetical protein PVAP13_2KG477600 [Panicum virgatum]